MVSNLEKADSKADDMPEGKGNRVKDWELRAALSRSIGGTTGVSWLPVKKPSASICGMSW